ncbi:glycosyltransferase family 92 protein, partial [Brevibacterium casei]|uniref:glycosyltransferase family 92 protein n=1 Tax=Brevibacterium casei TaxID=33889 RepID=UPI001C9316DD
MVIYDNNSTDYSLEDLSNAVAAGGADVSVVVDWPFKFGPQGGKWNGPVERPWDSDFCEYGINEHARWKYLSESKFVIAHDIDELLLVNQNTPILDVATSYPADYLSYSGAWVEDTPRSDSTVPRFRDFYYTDPHAHPTTRKWSALTSRIADATQWKTHSIGGASHAKTPEITHRHFKGITTNWKWSRSGRLPDY